MLNSLKPSEIVRPSVKEKYSVRTISGEGIFLISENDSFLLEGEIFEYILPLIDGIATCNDIAERLSQRFPPSNTIGALKYLAECGHIVEADPDMPPEMRAFWAELNVDTRLIPNLFHLAPVRIINFSARDHPSLNFTLEAFGLEVSDQGKVLLVVVDDYLDDKLEFLNKECLRLGIPWLLCKPDGLNIWLGPLFLPSRSPCWKCLSTRLLENRDAEKYLLSKTQRVEPAKTTRARLWPSAQQAYSMAAMQLARWIATGSNSSLEYSILIAETVPLQFSSHHVTKRPQCVVCGDAGCAQAKTEAFNFTSRPKIHLVDGGERIEAPEVTFERFKHLISPVSGVVRAIQPSVWNSISPIRTYTAGHNFAFNNQSIFFLKDSLRMNSSGKGRADCQAKTSALCEALERYSGVYSGSEGQKKATFGELGANALHPNECMLFSNLQYQNRSEWNNRQSRFQIVPMPLNASVAIDWSSVWSHTEQKIKLLPTSYLYYGYPYDQNSFFCWADSNGNAAGSSIEDACLQGFYELIERDAVAIWWYNRIQRPQLDLMSLDDPYIMELDAFYKKLDREFWVLDVTNDIGIPTFVAINRRKSGSSEDIVMGFGTHIDVRIAASRAITEMNQFIPAVLGKRSDGTTIYTINDIESVSWWKFATIENQSYLVPSAAEPARSIAHYHPSKSTTVTEKLEQCISNVQALGHEVLFLNQTRPDIGLSVVKVLVPGLRHFWARFAPGRLYDVPVKLGWTSKQLNERDLNPIAMFL